MRFPILLFISLFTLQLQAQKVLQIETYGKAKTIKIFMGSELTYRIGDNKTWETGTLDDVIPDDNIVVFNNRYIKLDDISAIKTYRNRNWSRSIGNNIYIFGASWAAYALVAGAVDPDDTYTWGDAAVTGVAAITGTLLKQIFKSEKTKFGKRKRLRIVDMTVKKQKSGY